MSGCGFRRGVSPRHLRRPMPRTRRCCDCSARSFLQHRSCRTCRRRPTTIPGYRAPVPMRTAPLSPPISASAATRWRHRAAIRDDDAGPQRPAGQSVAVWHLAHQPDGAGGPRSDLFRPARQRDADLPCSDRPQGAGHLPGLPRHPGRSGRRRSTVRLPRPVPTSCDRDGGRGAIPAGQSVGTAGRVRGAGARRRVLHRVPPHGSRQADTEKFRDAPQNRCVAQRQDYLNPGATRVRPHLHR